MAEVVRQRVVLSGRVHGVGFRFHTVNLAQQYTVTGYVCNLPGDEVEIVAEGRREQVEAFLDRAIAGPRLARVTGIRTFSEEPRHEFSAFDVRY